MLSLLLALLQTATPTMTAGEPAIPTIPDPRPPAPAASTAPVPAYARLPARSCGRTIQPREAIERAAAMAPEGGVAGCFFMVVRRVGEDGRGDLFLDSEEDYRDQRSLNVHVGRRAAAALRSQLGTDDVAAALNGRAVLVDGAAFRTRIDFTDGSRPTGQYYYQTHVRVGDVRQLARPAPY